METSGNANIKKNLLKHPDYSSPKDLFCSFFFSSYLKSEHAIVKKVSSDNKKQ